MQTSFHKNTQPCATDEAGFSLLEILVVLSIIGLMTALVTPRLVSSIDAAKFSETANTAAGRVSQIRAEAVLYGKAFIVAPTQRDINQTEPQINRLGLPNDWKITGGPVYITKSGLCTGGILELIDPTGRRARYEFNSPQCKAKRITVTNTG